LTGWLLVLSCPQQGPSLSQDKDSASSSPALEGFWVAVQLGLCSKCGGRTLQDLPESEKAVSCKTKIKFLTAEFAFEGREEAKEK
jgi:hypothetical protein